MTGWKPSYLYKVGDRIVTLDRPKTLWQRIKALFRRKKEVVLTCTDDESK